MLDQVHTRPAPTSGSSTARPVTTDSRPSQPKGAVSNSRRLIVGVVDAGGQQPGGELVGVGPGVAEPEGAGVGGQPGVEAGGQLLVDGDAELVEQPGDQGHRGRGAAVDQPHVPEAGVAGVVVDDDRDARRRRAAAASSPSRPGEAASRLTNTSGEDGHRRRGHQPLGAGQPAQRRRAA